VEQSHVESTSINFEAVNILPVEGENLCQKNAFLQITEFFPQSRLFSQLTSNNLDLAPLFSIKRKEWIVSFFATSNCFFTLFFHKRNYFQKLLKNWKQLSFYLSREKIQKSTCVLVFKLPRWFSCRNFMKRHHFDNNIAENYFLISLSYLYWIQTLFLHITVRLI